MYDSEETVERAKKQAEDKYPAFMEGLNKLSQETGVIIGGDIPFRIGPRREPWTFRTFRRIYCVAKEVQWSWSTHKYISKEDK